MDYAKESLRLHGEWKGKIEVVTTVPVETKDDLSLAYTPGVAQPCLEIQKDVDKSYDLTRRWNMCLVVTDGSAVLGLGDIGPEAGMPVMEGKCVLFKAFGDVDAFPLCIKSHDVDEIVNTIYLISGSFGGVNLEEFPLQDALKLRKSSKKNVIFRFSMMTSTELPSLLWQALPMPLRLWARKRGCSHSHERSRSSSHFHCKTASEGRI